MKQNNMTFLPFKFPLCPQLECNENVREIGYHLTILERLDCHNIKYVARNILESSVEIWQIYFKIGFWTLSLKNLKKHLILSL
jgi:hypothetical protein